MRIESTQPVLETRRPSRTRRFIGGLIATASLATACGAEATSDLGAVNDCDRATAMTSKGGIQPISNPDAELLKTISNAMNMHRITEEADGKLEFPHEDVRYAFTLESEPDSLKIIFPSRAFPRMTKDTFVIPMPDGIPEITEGAAVCMSNAKMYPTYPNVILQQAVEESTTKD